jgi:hypothetical protein
MSPRTASLEQDLRWFLNDLCTQWGFCLSAEARDQLALRPSVSADEFASSVLEEEGMNPQWEKQWLKKIRNRFIETFGLSVSADDYDLDL